MIKEAVPSIVGEQGTFLAIPRDWDVVWGLPIVLRLPQATIPSENHFTANGW